MQIYWSERQSTVYSYTEFLASVGMRNSFAFEAGLIMLWCHVRRDVVVPRRCDGSDRGSDHDVCEYLLKLALCNSCFCGRMKK